MTLKKSFIFFTSLFFLLSFSLTLFAGSNDDPESGFHITPTLQVVTDNSVGIMWESYNSDTGTIKVSTNSNMSGAITLSSSSSKIHKVTVNGLSENTRYYYTVSTDGAATSTKSFVTTLPKGDTSSFRFIVYGDTRLAPWYEDIVAKYGDNDDHLPVCQSMMSYSPDFLLHVGDFVYSGKDMDDIY
ncbi:MAG: hypothetical protein GY754_47115, partial [bacterium]|nr:hypothetical protein [bacterium]